MASRRQSIGDAIMLDRRAFMAGSILTAVLSSGWTHGDSLLRDGAGNVLTDETGASLVAN